MQKHPAQIITNLDSALEIAKRLIVLCEAAKSTLVWFYMGPYGGTPDLNISEWSVEVGNLKTCLTDIEIQLEDLT